MISYILAALAMAEPVVQADITYRTVAGRELKLDFYPPVTASSAPAPLVVVIHGGAWMTGNKKDMAQMCEALSRQGFAAATIQYRLASQTTKWPAMLDDAQAAVRYLRAKADTYKIDPKRVGAVGASAGAHLALLLGMMDSPADSGFENAGMSSRVKSVVNLFGPTDLSADFEPAMSALVSMMVLGKPLDKADAEIKQFSPVNHASKESAPVFTIHGTADAVVPVKQAERLDKALKAAGVRHEKRIIEGLGHNDPTTLPEGRQALSEALAFLNETLAAEKQ